MIEQFQTASSVAQAMSAGGISAAQILNRLVQKREVDENVKTRIQQARSTGVPDDKIVGDLVQISQMIQPTVKKEDFGIKGLLGSVGRFFGTEKVGRRIGAEVAKYGPGGAEHQRTLAKVGEMEEKGYVEPSVTRTLETGGVSGREFVGGLGKMGLSLGTAFMPAGALSPAYVEMKQAMIRSGAIGAGFGAAGALEQGYDNQQVVSAAITSGIIGAMFPPAMEGLKKIGQSLKGIPKKLYNSYFKTSSAQKAKEWRLESKGIPFKRPAELALEQGRKGNLDDIAIDIIKDKTSIEKEIQKMAAIGKKKVQLSVGNLKKASYIDMLDDIGGLYDNKKYMEPVSKAAGFVKELKATKGYKISQDLALRLRRFLDNQRTLSSFAQKGTRLSMRQQAFVKYTESLRGQIRIANPILGTKIALEGAYIEQLKSLLPAATRAENAKVIGLIDAMLGGGGFLTGQPLSGIAPTLAFRALTAPPVQTGMAAGMQRYLVDPTQRFIQKELPRGLGQIGPQIERGARQLGLGQLGQK